MKFMIKIPTTAIRKICLVIPLIFLSVSVFAEPPPAKMLYVGAISINPCQDAKILADWYSRIGIETKEVQGGFGKDQQGQFASFHDPDGNKVTIWGE
jgi:hypothetical protein